MRLRGTNVECWMRVGNNLWCFAVCGEMGGVPARGAKENSAVFHHWVCWGGASPQGRQINHLPASKILGRSILPPGLAIGRLWTPNKRPGGSSPSPGKRCLASDPLATART